jgi:hypothetical protein
MVTSISGMNEVEGSRLISLIEINHQHLTEFTPESVHVLDNTKKAHIKKVKYIMNNTTSVTNSPLLSLLPPLSRSFIQNSI